MDVSIVIVNYNTKELLRQCIESIYEQTKELDFEIIISDNGSTDGSIEMLKANFSKVIVISNNENLGFGRANNRGQAIAKGKYIFYLNSDTILLNNAVKIFFDYFEKNENQGLGAIGCNLCNKNFQTNFSYGDFGTSFGHIKELIKNILKNNKYTLNKILFHKPFPDIPTESSVKQNKYGAVDYICGADLFMKNNALARFDENYFLYFEEIDLQYNLFRNKLSRELIDGPRIMHLQGGSAKTTKKEVLFLTNFSEIQSNLSSIYYYKKNISSKFSLFFIKLLTIMMLSNPYIRSKTKQYFKKIMST